MLELIIGLFASVIYVLLTKDNSVGSILFVAASAIATAYLTTLAFYGMMLSTILKTGSDEDIKKVIQLLKEK